MKELVIPDVHQRVSLLEKLLARWESEVDRVIFLGDYFDGKGMPGDVPDAPSLAVDWLVDSLERDNRVHLLGNHDLSYRWPEHCICSGHRESTKLAIGKAMSQEHWRRMGYAVYSQGWLISHAGVHPRFFDPDQDPPAQIESFLDELAQLQRSVDPSSKLLQAGSARGGEQDFGGVTWLDWIYEFEPVKGISQIVGHTWDPDQVRCIKMGEGGDVERFAYSVDEAENIEPMPLPLGSRSLNWCIDCSLQVVAILEDGVLALKSAT